MSFLDKISDRLTTMKPVKGLIEKSRKTTLPGFNNIPLYDVIQFFFGQVKKIGMTERASAIAFNFVIAIPPAIIFMFTLIPFLPISKQFENGIYTLIREVVPSENDHVIIINFLSDFINNPRTGLLSLGFILSMYFSSNAMMGIMRSFDKKYIGFKKRTNLQKRGIALKLTVVLYLVVLLCIFFLISRKAVLAFLGIENQFIMDLLVNSRWVSMVLLFFFSTSLIYRYAPAVHKKWKLINPGSILATVMMLLLTMVFSWWVSNFGNYHQLYGSISIILIIMLMIFMNSLILLIGFELNVSISSLRKISEQRNSEDLVDEG